jgi:threonine aldolase
MGNQIALRLLGRPGTAVAIGRRQHPVIYEEGAAAVNGTAQLHLLDDDGGTLDLAELRSLVDASRHHWLPVSAVCIENTHMPAGGVAWQVERVEEVASIGLPMHLDGARLFNASVATGTPAATYAAPAATVMCCLSKGLGAPVGSMVAGSAELMRQARIERKRFGGSMRQAGVIAAAGLVALDYIDRLADDHRRARALAEAVAERWPDSGLDPAAVQTNCVLFEHADTRSLIAHLEREGIKAGTIAPRIVRLMTHLDVDDEDVDHTRKALLTAP